MKNIILFTFLLSVSAYYCILFFKYDFPLKARNNDHYTFVGVFEADNRFITKSQNYEVFPDAQLSTMHSNVVSLLLGSITTIFSNSIVVSGVAGGIGVFLFYLTFYLFILPFIQKFEHRMFVLILLLLSAPINTSYATIGSGLYDLASIPATGFTYQIIGYSFLFVSFYFLVKLLKGNNSAIYLLFITTALLLNIHPFIYLSFLILGGTYVLLELINKNIKAKVVSAIIISQILAIVVNQYFWPFSKIITNIYFSTIQFQSGQIAKGLGNYAVNDIGFYFENLSIALIGYLFLCKEKNVFLKTATIILSILVFQYFFPMPFKIPMVWRLIGPLKILLLLIISRNIFTVQSKVVRLIIVFFIINLSFINVINTLNLTIKHQNDYELYKEISKTDVCSSKPLILSDPDTSNMIQAINGCTVYFINVGHIADYKLDVIDIGRTQDILELKTENDPEKNLQYMKENKISMIIIDSKYDSDISRTINNLKFPPNKIILLYSNDRLKIEKIDYGV